VSKYLPIAVALLSVLAAACTVKQVNLYAPPELADGVVKIDGKIAATLSTATRNYRWVGWRGLRKELNAPPRSETFAHFDVPPGDHILTIEKEGFEPIMRRFTSSGREPLTIDIRSTTPRADAASPGASEEPQRRKSASRAGR